MGLIRHLPLPVRLPLIRAASAALAAVRRRGEPAKRGAVPGPLIVDGFAGEVLGVGVAGRMTGEALTDAGFAVETRSLRPALKRAWFGARPPVHERPGGVWLIHANAPEGAMALMAHDRADWEGRYRIGYWAWETTEAPESWARLVHWFDEIWVPSRFVAEALGAALDRIGRGGLRDRVSVMPHPVRAPEGVAARPLEPGVRHALVMFDGRSAYARKNPWAAVEAWTRAVPEPRADWKLVIKGVDLLTDPAAARRLEALAEARSDVVIYEARLDESELWDFLAGMDLVISLHRAEGFGLVPAQAMVLGKAVVMTAHSGPADFADAASAALVPATRIPAHDPSGAYRDGDWFEPDVEAAAREIARLLDDPEARQALGHQARRRVAALTDPWKAEALSTLPFAAFVEKSAKRPAP